MEAQTAVGCKGRCSCKYVHFLFKPEVGQAFVDKDAYILGEMNNCRFNDNDKLGYNLSALTCQSSLLLKQVY